MTFKNTLFAGTLATIATMILVSGSMAANLDTDSDGIPDTAEPLLGTDPMNADTDGDGINDLKDQAPTSLSDPIVQSGQPAPFEISESLVENNFDYALNKDAPDHLELLVKNDTNTQLGNFSIYYTITDEGSGKTESYFRTLDNFTVPAKGESRIHLDQSGAPGHFRANPNSIYKTTLEAKQVTFELKLDGFQPVTAEVHKDKGGAEGND